MRTISYSVLYVKREKKDPMERASALSRTSKGWPEKTKPESQHLYQYQQLESRSVQQGWRCNKDRRFQRHRRVRTNHYHRSIIWAHSIDESNWRGRNQHDLRPIETIHIQFERRLHRRSYLPQPSADIVKYTLASSYEEDGGDERNALELSRPEIEETSLNTYIQSAGSANGT